jgi:hypothetical protein
VTGEDDRTNGRGASERFEIYAAPGPDAAAGTIREAAEKALWMLSPAYLRPVLHVFVRDSETGRLIALDRDSAHMYCGPVPEPQSRKADPV